MSTYEIEMLPGGGVDVTKDRRAYAYDLDDVEEALDRIRRDEGSGYEVFLVEEDGYRTRLTT